MGVETVSKTFIPPQKQPLGRRREKMGLTDYQLCEGGRTGDRGVALPREVTGEAPGLGKSQD